MDDRSRREIAAHFERTVGRPPAGARDRVLGRLAGGARPRRREQQWLAGVAAVVLAAVLVAALLVSQHLPRPQPVVSPPPPGAGTPQPRFGAAVTYDQARGSLLLFGGSAGKTVLADTWTWNGTRWALQRPKVAPPGRTNAVVAYDESRRVVVLFGGAPQIDTWTWDGRTWTAHPDAATPPDVQDLDRMAYDPASRSVILFAPALGVSGTSRTWSWTGETWVELHPKSPPAVVGGTLASDGKRLILFGDTFFGGSHPETWAWDGADWTRLSPPVAVPVAGPAAYDAARGRLVAVLSALGGVGSETWTWDGTSWARLHPATEPDPGTAGSVLVYDSRARRVLMYSADVGASAAIWAWDGTRWSRVLAPVPVASPSSPPRPVRPTPAAVPPDQVPGLVAGTVTGVNPRLLPGSVPPAITECAVTASSGGFGVTYSDDLHTRSIRFAILAPQPPPLGPNGKASTIRFRGTTADYRVLDATDPLSIRTLSWTEPGTIEGGSPLKSGGIPYSLSASGLTEAEFLAVANSITAV